jgi:putative transposase
VNLLCRRKLARYIYGLAFVKDITMKILRAYKTELDPNNKQRTMFLKHAGTARFVYNWALADRINLHKEGKSTNLYEQKKRFNALKDAEFPWIREVAYKSVDASLRNLDAAYQNFFRRIKKGDNPGFPKFKSKKKGTGSFTVRGCIHIESNRVKLPIIGWVKLKERGYLPVDGTARILSCNVSERAGRWYISAQVEIEAGEKQATNEPIGIDFGIKSLAVCSDGTVFENPHVLKKAERKLKRLQREVSRRVKGSNNRDKSRIKLARQHAKVADIRKHILHNISHHVTAKTKPRVVVLEDLNVKGMLANHHLAQAISDVSFGELRRQIEYKAGWNGVEIVMADRWYASSKTCSKCGTVKKDLTLADRIYVCENCGAEIDRDYNAALNLLSLAS